MNAAIGGPHESFAKMGAHYGSMSVVFANLSQQIESYRTVGPPSISKALMSEEDHEFAEKFKYVVYSINNVWKNALVESR